MILCGPAQAADVLAVLRAAFAGMDARIDPPSSLNRMGIADIEAQMTEGEIWGDGPALKACVFLTPRGDHLYLGKLAVHPDHRRQGLATHLVSHALDHAAELGLPAVQLQSRVELAENHMLFRSLGFQIVAETRHAGYDRPTSLTFCKAL